MRIVQYPTSCQSHHHNSQNTAATPTKASPAISRTFPSLPLKSLVIEPLFYL